MPSDWLRSVCSTWRASSATGVTLTTRILLSLFRRPGCSRTSKPIRFTGPGAVDDVADDAEPVGDASVNSELEMFTLVVLPDPDATSSRQSPSSPGSAWWKAWLPANVEWAARTWSILKSSSRPSTGCAASRMSPTT